MEIGARVSSKGQITVPKAVRDALGLEEGDRVVFRIEGRRAMFARTANLLDLGGSVEVPSQQRRKRWSQVRAETRTQRARSRR